jgi:hypothetical protein
MTHDRDKYRSDAKAKVARLTADPKGKVDASDYTPPGALDAQHNTYVKQPVKRAFKDGGKARGEAAACHNGRKARAPGGGLQAPINVPSGGLYGSGTSPNHAGPLATVAGLKRGGKARKHGGKTGPDGMSSAIHDGLKAGDRVARAHGGKATKGKTNINIVIASPSKGAGDGAPGQLMTPPPAPMPPHNVPPPMPAGMPGAPMGGGMGAAGAGGPPQPPNLPPASMMK